MPLEIIFGGILMGLAFAAPPGVVTAETLRRGIRGGFPLAFQVQAGSLIGDAAYAALALAGLAALAQHPAMQIALGAFGAMFLMYLAWSSFQSARVRISPSTSALAGEERSAFLSGLALSLSNPWAIAFWLSLGGALASFGLVNASVRETAIFFTSFIFGSALWAIAISFAVAHVRGMMRPGIFKIVSITCGIALGVFGLSAASQVLLSIFGTSY